MSDSIHRVAGFLGFILACMIFVALFSFKSEAAELVEVQDVSTVSSGDPIVEYVVEFPESIATYDLNEDEYNFNQVSTYAVNSDVYAGSYNSTIISIWNGLLNNNVGKDYVAYRSSQYEYYIFFGEDFQVSGSTFSGSGSYYYLNTYSNGYAYSYGFSSFTVDVSSGYLYTNVSPDFPSLDNDRGLIYEQIQTVLLIALLGVSLLRRILARK